MSVEAAMKSPPSHLFNSREFTFPESSPHRKRPPAILQPIVPALTPRDTPLQAKIEKLAKQKRKERVINNKHIHTNPEVVWRNSFEIFCVKSTTITFSYFEFSIYALFHTFPDHISFQIISWTIFYMIKKPIWTFINFKYMNPLDGFWPGA